MTKPYTMKALSELQERIERLEYYHPQYTIAEQNDPAYFIETRIKVAGFPLILHPEVAEFVYQLNRETEVTTHNVGKGHGLTTGMLAYLVWKAYTKPGTYHVLATPKMYETMELMIHVAAMARSIGPDVVRKVGRDIEFENGSKILGISVSGNALGLHGVRGLTLSTIACDGFSKLSEARQAEIALETGWRVDTQTILV